LQVWDFISTLEGFGESVALVHEELWLEYCQSVFDTVLEGYSRVRKCSSEGRAAMTKNVYALHDGLNLIHLCRPPRGKHYLDNYLRSCYLIEDEIMNWIRENYQSYAYRHVHSLLSQTMSSMLNSKKLRDAVAVVDELYNFEDNSEANNNNNNNSLSSIARMAGRTWPSSR
jgi:hypothetical protein